MQKETAPQALPLSERFCEYASAHRGNIPASDTDNNSGQGQSYGNSLQYSRLYSSTGKSCHKILGRLPGNYRGAGGTARNHSAEANGICK